MGVGFVQGDLRMPVILGGLYSRKAVPPTARKDEDIEMVRTKGGHELVFEDTPDNPRVHLLTTAGHRVDLHDQDQHLTAKTVGGHTLELHDAEAHATVTTSGGHKIAMHDLERHVSASTSGGHTLELHDLQQKASIRTTAGHTVEMSDAAQQILVRTTGGHMLTMQDTVPMVSLTTITGQSVLVNDALQTITITTAKGQTIILNPSGVVIHGATIFLDGPNVLLKNGQLKEPAVLGLSMQQLFNTHIHMVGPIPTTPPIPVMTPEQLALDPTP